MIRLHNSKQNKKDMRVLNRNIRREYEILEELEAGIMLTGAEVKSTKAGNIKLEGSHVKIVQNEVLLVGAQIPIYIYARPEGYDPSRTRKLLLKKREILRLQTKIKSGSRLTIVPVACYNKKGLIKLTIALAKGKRAWEQKETDKRRSETKRIRSEIKEY